MTTLKEAAREFLSKKRIAVAGVSRGGAQPANTVYRKLRDSGYEVFPVNPNADAVEGDTCYPDLKAIPGGVDGVLIATHPKAAGEIVRQCRELGVSRVWMHRSLGQGSVSEAAVQYCRDNGISVIAGACPMMFREPVDLGHKCMRWVLGLTGGLPRNV